MNTRTGRFPVPGTPRASTATTVDPILPFAAALLSVGVFALLAVGRPALAGSAHFPGSFECADAQGRFSVRSDAADSAAAGLPDITWTIDGEAHLESGGSGGRYAGPGVDSSTETSAEVGRATTADPGVVVITTVRYVTLVSLPARAPLYEGWQLCEERRRVEPARKSAARRP